MSNFINLLDIIYPVGSVYITFNETSPADVIGGTWELLENAFLYSSIGSTGVTGGEETHTLTMAEMPKHNHFCDFASSGFSGSSWVTKYAQYKPEGGWYTKDTGNSQAHNNMPPYITVHIYHRTA